MSGSADPYEAMPVAVAQSEFDDGAIIRIPIASEMVSSFKTELVTWMSRARPTSGSGMTASSRKTDGHFG
jgi:hypothetical protein